MDKRRENYAGGLHIEVAYKQVDGITLCIDLYMPDNAKKPPLIMWIHGGAWMYRDRKSPIKLWQVERGDDEQAHPRW